MRLCIGEPMKSFKQLLRESTTPAMFSRTHYRLPTEEELVDIDRCNLDPKQIVNGFSYTIIGRGMRSAQNTEMITKSLDMLYAMFSKPEYKKAIELYKESQGKSYEIV